MDASEWERNVVFLHLDAPGLSAEVPYNIAEVDLEEGLRIITNIVGCPNAALQIGMPLEVTFEDVTDEVTLPKFKPIE